MSRQGNCYRPVTTARDLLITARVAQEMLDPIAEYQELFGMTQGISGSGRPVDLRPLIRELWQLLRRFGQSSRRVIPESPAGFLTAHGGLAALDQIIAWCQVEVPANAADAGPTANPVKGKRRKKRATKMTVDARAVAVFIENKESSVEQIANEIGASVKTLYSKKRCPKFRAVRKAYKDASPPPRGTKTQDGQLEAFSDG